METYRSKQKCPLLGGTHYLAFPSFRGFTVFRVWAFFLTGCISRIHIIQECIQNITNNKMTNIRVTLHQATPKTYNIQFSSLLTTSPIFVIWRVASSAKSALILNSIVRNNLMTWKDAALILTFKENPLLKLPVS